MKQPFSRAWQALVGPGDPRFFVIMHTLIYPGVLSLAGSAEDWDWR